MSICHPLTLRRIYLKLPCRLRGGLKALLLPLLRGRVVFEAQTDFNSLQVIEKKGLRYLVFLDSEQCPNVQFPESFYQSYVAVDETKDRIPPYASYCHLGPLFNPRISGVLLIGLGGGVIPRQFLNEYPSIKKLKVIEIDPTVVQVAQEYFYLPEDERLNIVVGDGRQQLEIDKSCYDLILLDVFLAKSIPFHLVSVEFFQTVKERLSPRGIVIINVYGALAGKNSSTFKRIFLSLRQVLPNVAFFPDLPEQQEKLQSIIIVGSENIDFAQESKFIDEQCLYNLQSDRLEQILNRLYNQDLEIGDIRPIYDRERPASGVIALWQ